MTNPLRGYSALISSATGANDAPTIALIEDFVRQETGGCLDHLPVDRFTALARMAYADARAWNNLGKVNGITLAAYCDAIGLVPPSWANP